MRIPGFRAIVVACVLGLVATACSSGSSQSTTSSKTVVYATPSLALTMDPCFLPGQQTAEILQNLMENAHRFGPEGAEVTVGASRDEAGSRVWVVDKGPGIPPADLARVFERFYKVDRARTRGDEGSGLGLAITRRLVQAHGGDVWAEAGEQGGTRLVFTLPAGEI